VSFDAGYRSLPALAELIHRSSVVVLPYDSPDQVTSGVLVDAVAAGRPVVATAFPHAVELLASGAGIVVPRRDPEALASALRHVLTEPSVADAMASEAERIAPSLAWSAIAAQYASLADQLVTRRSAGTSTQVSKGVAAPGSCDRSPARVGSIRSARSQICNNLRWNGVGD